MRKPLRLAADSSHNLPPAPTYILLAKASFAHGRRCHKISHNKKWISYENPRSTASRGRRRCKDLSLVTDTLLFHVQSCIERTLNAEIWSDQHSRALVPGNLARAVSREYPSWLFSALVGRQYTPVLLRSTQTSVYGAFNGTTKKKTLTQKYLPNSTSIDHRKNCTKPDLSRH